MTHRARPLPLLLSLIVGVSTGPMRAADLPPDLALVPADAFGFAHVRVAEVWKSQAATDYRAGILKAGPDVLAALDAQFAPAPSTLERGTLVVVPGADPKAEPKAFGVLRFSAAFDPDRVLACVAPGANPVSGQGVKHFVDEKLRLALTFPDNRTIVVADPGVLPDVLARRRGPGGKLGEALAAAPGGAFVTAAVDVTRLPVPPEATKDVPPPFRPLLKTGLITFSAGGPAGRAELRADYPTPADAEEAEKAVRAAAGMARQAMIQPRQQAEQGLAGPAPGGPPRPLDQLPEAVGSVFALGYLNMLDELLANPPLTREGTALTAGGPIPALLQGPTAMPIAIGLLLPAVQKVREAAARATSQNNLKQIGLAVQNYHDVYARFPGPAVTDKAGKPLLSWRVAILPFIDQDALYKRFKLDEPWDSDHNKKLIPLMPKVYADPRLGLDSEKTVYKAFVGQNTAFPPSPKKVTLGGIADGTSNTILAVAAGEPVVWTKPEDIAFDPDGPLPDLFKPSPTLLAVFCDGAVRGFAPPVDANTLKAMITANGGEVYEMPTGQPGGSGQWQPVGQSISPAARPAPKK